MSKTGQPLTLFSGTETASATQSAVTFKQAWRTAQIVLAVTAAATAVGDTLDVYIDTSPDGGTTWINIGHFTQVLGNGGAKSFVMALGPDNPGASAVTATTSDASAGATRQYGINDRLRSRSVIVSSSAPSFTYSVKAYLKN